jgi:hypothetical protein
VAFIKIIIFPGLFQGKNETHEKAAAGISAAEPMSATDMVATPRRGARFLSVEKAADEISATGGRRRLSPHDRGAP